MDFWSAFHDELSKVAKGQLVYRLGKEKVVTKCDSKKSRGPQLPTNDGKDDGVDNVNVKQFQ